MIVFLSKYYSPHIGGVEKHIQEISKVFLQQGYKISLVTEKHNKSLVAKEKIKGVEVYRFSYPKIKFLGLFCIWVKLFEFFSLFAKAEIIHIHDVFIWFLPLRFIFFWKKVYLTAHGWEGVYPIPIKNIILKRLSVALSTKTICVGKYIEKYYGIKADKIIYGGAVSPTHFAKKDPRLILYLGRLDKDTGLDAFLKACTKLKEFKIEFCGDGPLLDECKKVGKVYGFVDPYQHLAKASICFASGYLTVLEALAHKCKVIVSYDNPLRKDMFVSSPLKKYIFLCKNQAEIFGSIKSKKKEQYKNIPSWLEVVNAYKEVYNCVI